MSAAKKNVARLQQARSDLSAAADRLDSLRSELLVIHDAIRDADDVDKSAKELCFLCVRTCREIALSMRSDARLAIPESSGLLRKAGVGVGALASWLVIGGATGIADGLVTHAQLSAVEKAASAVVSECEQQSSDDELLPDDPLPASVDRALRGVLHPMHEIGLATSPSYKFLSYSEGGRLLREAFAQAAKVEDREDGMLPLRPDLERLNRLWEEQSWVAFEQLSDDMKLNLRASPRTYGPHGTESVR